MAARFLAEDPRNNMFSEDDDDDDSEDGGRWNNKRQMADPEATTKTQATSSNSKEDAAIEEIYGQSNKKQRTKRNIVSAPQLKDILTNIPNHFKMNHHQKWHPKLQNTVPCMGLYLRSMLAMYHQDIFQANEIDVPLIQKLAPQLKGFLQDLRLHVTRNPHLEATLGVEAAHRLMQQLDERTNDTPASMAATSTTIAATTAHTTAMLHRVDRPQATITAVPTLPAAVAATANNPYSKSRETTTTTTVAAEAPTRAIRNEESLLDNSSSARTLPARSNRQQRRQVLDDTSDEEELQFNDDRDDNAFRRKKTVIRDEDNDETTLIVLQNHHHAAMHETSKWKRRKTTTSDTNNATGISDLPDTNNVMQETPIRSTQEENGTAKVAEDTNEMQEANETTPETESETIMNETTLTPVLPITADTQEIQIASFQENSSNDDIPYIQEIESPCSRVTDCRSTLEAGESSATEKFATNDDTNDTNILSHATANHGPKAIDNTSDQVAIVATGMETSRSLHANSSATQKSKDSHENINEDSTGIYSEDSAPTDSFMALESNSFKLGQETQEMMTDDEDEIATIVPTMLTTLSGPTQSSP